jgi:hypothetical protein
MDVSTTKPRIQPLAAWAASWQATERSRLTLSSRTYQRRATWACRSAGALLAADSARDCAAAWATPFVSAEGSR